MTILGDNKTLETLNIQYRWLKDPKYHYWHSVFLSHWLATLVGASWYYHDDCLLSFCKSASRHWCSPRCLWGLPGASVGRWGRAGYGVHPASGAVFHEESQTEGSKSPEWREHRVDSTAGRYWRRSVSWQEVAACKCSAKWIHRWVKSVPSQPVLIFCTGALINCKKKKNPSQPPVQSASTTCYNHSVSESSCKQSNN